MTKSAFGTIIQIGDCLVSEEVVTEYFACDYGRCRGCCCVVGDSGAPLQESEAEELERNLDNYSDFLTEEGRAILDRDGFFQIDRDGDMVTPVISSPHFVEGLDFIPGTEGLVGTTGLEDCAYIRYEKDAEGKTICLCGVERSFYKGLCSFRKPDSCWLYPIRVKDLGNGTRALNLHRWAICGEAFDKGRREGTRVYQFLKEPLVSIFGKDFYEALDAAARHINGE